MAVNNIFTKPNTKTGAKALAGLAGIAYAASANQAEGATSGWSADGRTGMYVNNNGSDGYVTLSVHMKNNSNNFTIENGEVFSYNILDAVYNMTQLHNTFTGSKTDFMNAVDRRIDETDSEVKGLDYTINSSGIDTFEQGGRNADEFLSTDQEPNKDSSIYDILIPKSMTDWDHNGYVQGSGDGLSLVQQASSYDTWKGENELNQGITAQGNWIAIPELTTPALMTLGALAIAGRKYFRNKLNRE
jgi:hypothetical protein